MRLRQLPGRWADIQRPGKEVNLGFFDNPVNESDVPSESHPPERPDIGIIMLDTRFPRLPGDVGNPQTFPFPVSYEIVKGASPQRVVKAADPSLLGPFIDAARALEARGARVIATSCGFLAIFQRQLADAVGVPVYSSALLQIGMARAVMRSDQAVGIITADRGALTAAHFEGVGIADTPAAIIGMETAAEFSSVFMGGKRSLDSGKCRREMVNAATQLLAAHPEIGSIILECTNMPPYSAAVQNAVGLPVFDVVTLIHLAYRAAVQCTYPLS
jgi:aspartate/glutamate racemase